MEEMLLDVVKDDLFSDAIEKYSEEHQDSYLFQLDCCSVQHCGDTAGIISVIYIFIPVM